MNNDKEVNMLTAEYNRVMGEVSTINNTFLGLTVILTGVFAAISVFEQSELSSMLFPFVFAYYIFNILKYTLKVLEFRAYAVDIYMGVISKGISKNTFERVNDFWDKDTYKI